MRMNDIILIIDRNGNFVPMDLQNMGHIYTEGMEVSGRPLTDAYNVHDVALFLKNVDKALASRKTVNIEYSTPDGHEERWFEATVSPMTDDLTLFVARDITALKIALAKVKAENIHLQEVITALNLQMNEMKESLRELEDTMLSNIRTFVLPHIRNIKKTRLDLIQKTYIDLIEANLSKLTSSYLDDLRQFNLTPMEIQVANLIKEGKTTNDIAGLLQTSKVAIDNHRYNIRKKFGLTNTKENLRSVLLSVK